MHIEGYASGPFDTNAYVIYSSNKKDAVIVDPAPDSFEWINEYLDQNELEPSKIILTHSHWDHIADVPRFKSQFPHIKIYIHDLDKGNLQKPGSDGLPLFFRIQGCNPDVIINEGDVIQVGDAELEVIHTPGHTPGGVCFYDSKLGLLFSGDTLFQGTIGNLSFPTAEPDLMWESLDRLAKLPPKTIVYPGHGSSTTIGEEKWLPHAKEMFG